MGRIREVSRLPQLSFEWKRGSVRGWERDKGKRADYFTTAMFT